MCVCGGFRSCFCGGVCFSAIALEHFWVQVSY